MKIIKNKNIANAYKQVNVENIEKKKKKLKN